MGFGLDEGVQMHQIPMTGQPGIGAALGGESLGMQRPNDGADHQLVLMTILAGPEQVLRSVPVDSRGPCQAVTAQAT